MTYGKTFTFTNSSGSEIYVRVDGFETLEEAEREAIRIAKAHGWKKHRLFALWARLQPL